MALNTMVIKYIGTICFDIFWFVKELYIKLLYNNMGSCMFARKKIKKGIPVNGIDQRGHQIIRCPRIFRGLIGCQLDPRVGASQLGIRA